jgi:Domain of unknown function (DUF4234)
MAKTETLRGETYLKRDPLGVLGLTIVTLGIYGLYWYYKVHEEIRRFERDDSVRPGVALLAVTLGWLLIIPPFISVYNLSIHVADMETREELQQLLSPAVNVVLLLVLSVGIGIYTQEHLNRVWTAAASRDVAPLEELPPGPIRAMM